MTCVGSQRHKKNDNIVYIGNIALNANTVVAVKKKGKAIPLQAWTGPEVSRNLRLPDFKTAHEGGKVVSPTHRPPLHPGNIPGTQFC